MGSPLAIGGGRSATPIQQTRVSFFFDAPAPGAVDTLLTLVSIRDGVAGPGATSHGATAGTILRLSTIILAVRATAAFGPANGILYFRQNPAGATVIGSQAEFVLVVEPNANGSIGVGNTFAAYLPPEYEFQGAETFGVSFVSALGIVTNIINVAIIGSERPA